MQLHRYFVAGNQLFLFSCWIQNPILEFCFSNLSTFQDFIDRMHQFLNQNAEDSVLFLYLFDIDFFVNLATKLSISESQQSEQLLSLQQHTEYFPSDLTHLQLIMPKFNGSGRTTRWLAML